MSTTSVSRARVWKSSAGGGGARRRVEWLIEHRAQVLVTIALTAIVSGFLLQLAGAGSAGHQLWRAAVALLALELGMEVLRTIVVSRNLGVDTIALVAMIGALALDQELAGLVVGLMFSGGRHARDSPGPDPR
jgi:hypothetical protein